MLTDFLTTYYRLLAILIVPFALTGGLARGDIVRYSPPPL